MLFIVGLGDDDSLIEWNTLMKCKWSFDPSTWGEVTDVLVSY